jgi:aryl-alcohol dehydrogenase-like predicted oxidoreductase
MMSYGSPSWREWVLDLDASRPLVRDAVEAGITFFDTADSYSLGVGEEVTGTLLRELFPRREDYVLATKVFFPMSDRPNDRGLSRKHILAGIDASLRRLGTDYVDLYQIHRWDPDTPIEETMEALHDVVRAGKARYIGAPDQRWPSGRAPGHCRVRSWTPCGPRPAVGGRWSTRSCSCSPAAGSASPRLWRRMRTI